MSWTKTQMKDHVIDQIIKIIMINKKEPYFNNLTWKLDLNEHRKTISDSGYLVTGQNTTDKKLVIYQ